MNISLLWESPWNCFDSTCSMKKWYTYQFSCFHRWYYDAGVVPTTNDICIIQGICNTNDSSYVFPVGIGWSKRPRKMVMYCYMGMMEWVGFTIFAVSLSMSSCPTELQMYPLIRLWDNSILWAQLDTLRVRCVLKKSTIKLHCGWSKSERTQVYKPLNVWTKLLFMMCHSWTSPVLGPIMRCCFDGDKSIVRICPVPETVIVRICDGKGTGSHPVKGTNN